MYQDRRRCVWSACLLESDFLILSCWLSGNIRVHDRSCTYFVEVDDSYWHFACQVRTSPPYTAILATKREQFGT